MTIRYFHSDRTSNRRWSHCVTTADISMVMMMGGNFMQGSEIFTALPYFQVMNGMCVTWWPGPLTGLSPQIKQTKQTIQLQIDFGLIVTLQLISAWSWWWVEILCKEEKFSLLCHTSKSWMGCAWQLNDFEKFFSPSLSPASSLTNPNFWSSYGND